MTVSGERPGERQEAFSVRDITPLGDAIVAAAWIRTQLDGTDETDCVIAAGATSADLMTNLIRVMGDCYDMAGMMGEARGADYRRVVDYLWFLSPVKQMDWIEYVIDGHRDSGLRDMPEATKGAMGVTRDGDGYFRFVVDRTRLVGQTDVMYDPYGPNYQNLYYVLRAAVRCCTPDGVESSVVRVSEDTDLDFLMHLIASCGARINSLIGEMHSNEIEATLTWLNRLDPSDRRGYLKTLIFGGGESGEPSIGLRSDGLFRLVGSGRNDDDMVYLWIDRRHPDHDSRTPGG